nr:histidine kinase [Kibdelosporangium sp. MJ126-NF4]CTQ97190.1 two-component system sensor kinase [Kibdelosporangium sp. MJ126-NF4]
MIPLLLGAVCGSRLARRHPHRAVFVRFTCSVVGLAIHLAIVWFGMTGQYVTPTLDFSDRALNATLVMVVLNAPVWRARRFFKARTGKRVQGGDVEARESERRQIAGTLHDTVGQGLAVIAMQVRMAREAGARGPEWAAMENATVKSLAELREMIDELREPLSVRRTPAVVECLTEVISRFRSAGLMVDFTVAGRLDIVGHDVQRALVRVVREGLTNALKYDMRSPVLVILDVEDTITLAINSLSRLRTAAVPGKSRPQRGIGQFLSGGHGNSLMYRIVAKEGGTLSVNNHEDGFRIRATFALPGSGSALVGSSTPGKCSN